MSSSSKTVTIEDEYLGLASSFVEEEYQGWSDYLNDLIKNDLNDRGKLEHE